MLKRAVAVFLLAMVAAEIVSSCGGSSSTTSPGNGSLFTFVADAPLCDVLTFRMSFAGMSLTPTAGGNASTLINSVTTAGVKVNFPDFRDCSTVLNLSTVTAVAYNEVSIAFGTPTIVVYDPTQTPPTRTITGTLTTGTSTTPAKFPIDPPLTVTKVTSTETQVSGMLVELDLGQSLELDSNGQVTGKVTPAVTASALTSSANDGFGVIDGLRGFVSRVDPSVTSTTNSNIIGDFGLQLLSSTGPALLASLTKATQVCGPALISNPLARRFHSTSF